MGPQRPSSPRRRPVPAARRARAGEMLQEESDLSLTIAQIVQKLKGSSLYAQLERQAWVSEAAPEGGAGGRAALRRRLRPPASAGLPPASAGLRGPPPGLRGPPAGLPPASAGPRRPAPEPPPARRPRSRARKAPSPRSTSSASRVGWESFHEGRGASFLP